MHQTGQYSWTKAEAALKEPVHSFDYFINTEYKISPNASYTTPTLFKGTLASSLQSYPVFFSKFEVVKIQLFSR